jgi:putative SOS response-associated peptidase YedK
VLAPIHDRMPVILPRSAYDLWLDPSVHDPKRLEPLLVPFPAEPGDDVADGEGSHCRVRGGG